MKAGKKMEEDTKKISDSGVDQTGLGYQNTLMYGQYSQQLGDFAKVEGLKQAEKRRHKEERQRKKELQGQYQGRVAKAVAYIWRHTFAKLGEDWVFLAVLGLIMAVLSFIMDRGISICNKARIWLFRDLSANAFAQYAAWIALPVFLTLFSAGFVHLVAPQSIGSGIPEMKTILRGVTLKEYLTFRTLVAKVVGLTATLGSGMPLGKEGPFVHIASIVATLLSQLVTSFQGIYANESRQTEMLAAACAVGVASCFAAPVGGVLFSIEVTTVYFAVRNYWRGFFAAVCGATIFRLLAVWFEGAETVRAVFHTSLLMEFPFDPQELFVFALIGVGCGLGGALYVRMHRQYVVGMRNNQLITNFLKRNRFLYPAIVSIVVSSVSFPLGSGQFLAADLTTHEQVASLFSNFTWTAANLTLTQRTLLTHWVTAHTGVLVNLLCYILYTFLFSIVCSTVPVPSGSFIPVFKIGAAFGRIVGELMHVWFPSGLRYGDGAIAVVIPGGYATVGAAAFSGAVTHTISVSVIVFEMTGQITYLIPIMIAVLIANAVATLLAPSIYDSIIVIKKLPYLPDLLPSSSGMYNVYVEDFMVRDVKYIYRSMTYAQLKDVLRENRRLRSFPLVDNSENLVLVGSVQRVALIQLIERHIGRERRLQVAAIRRQREAEERAARLREVEEAAATAAAELEAVAAEQQRRRRSSRFHVVPAPDLLSAAAAASNRQSSEQSLNDVKPMKSILKKTNSFTLKGFSPLSGAHSPYTTVTGAESRIRLAFEAIFRKSAQLQDVVQNAADSSPMLNGVSSAPPPHPPQLLPSTAPPTTMHHPTKKQVQLPRERICDMSPEDQHLWEEAQMRLEVEFEAGHIDPAPFQLVERTSLLKVHSLFSMVGVNHAYVTAIGRLVGVVALKDLRQAIEEANSGLLPPPSPPPPPTTTSDDSSTLESVTTIGQEGGGVAGAEPHNDEEADPTTAMLPSNGKPKL